MNGRTVTVAAAVCAFAGVSSVCRADIVFISGNGTLGDFAGSVDYVSGSGLLTISLTNSLTTSPGGRITGLAFSIDGDAAASQTSAPNASFIGLTGPVAANPFGDFDAGSALGGSWLGGGSPAAGIAVGATGVWTFSVTGTDAGSLTASDFITESGVDGSHIGTFVVRFRGFDNGGSDKVDIPSPGMLGMVGLAGLCAARRRR